MIKNIYLINLDKRRDRLEHFIKQSKNSQVIQRYKRISAIDGLLLTDDELQANVTEKGYSDIVNNKKTNGLYLTRGAVGLALTYKLLLEKSDNTTLFLEDDIIVHNKFDNILNKAIQELPSDWDILYLGWYPSKNLIITNVSKNINSINGQINGTQGWLISDAGAKKFIKMFPISYQIDTEIYLNKNIKKYSTIYPIVSRSCLYFDSDIQN